MTPTTVLLDVDGCLVDSRVPILVAMNRALRQLDLRALAPDELVEHVGPPLHHTAGTILRQVGGDPGLTPTLIDIYREAYLDESIAHAASYPGVPEVVVALAEHFRLAVVTSKPIPFARPILDVLGLTGHLAGLFGPGLTEDEPKTVTLGTALTTLEVTAERTVMVGDRRHDVEAAHAHGARAVGVTWGFGSRQELEAASAEAVVDTPDQLLQVLTRS